MKAPRFVGDHWFWNHVPSWRWTNALYARIYGKWRPGLCDQFHSGAMIDCSYEPPFWSDAE